MDIPATKVVDPFPVRLGNTERPERPVGVREIRRPAGREQPLVDDLLHVPVEAGDDPEAARVDLLAGVRGLLAAQDDAELVADLPDEVCCLPRRGALSGQDDWILLGCLVFLGRVLELGQDAPGLHQIEDLVAPDDDIGVRGDDELNAGSGALVALGNRDRTDRLCILDQIELRGGLRNGREDRHFGEGEVREGLVEVPLGCRSDAIALIPVEVLVQVGGDDLLLPPFIGEGLGQADGLDDLPDLAFIGRPGERGLGQQTGADQLLGDRGSTARSALERVDRRGQETAEIESRIAPEILVLDRGGGVEEFGWDLVKGDELPLAFAEAREFDCPGPVVDDRGLVKTEIREGLRRVGEVAAVVGVGADRADEARPAKGEEAGEQKDRNGERCASCGSASTTGTSRGAGAAMALTPVETGLHIGRDDTIGPVEDLPPVPVHPVTPRHRAL